MQTLPIFIGIVLSIAMFCTVYLFWIAAGKRKIVLVILSGWAIVQAIISLNGFYLNTTGTPPRFVLAVAPPVLLLLALLLTHRGRSFLNSFSLPSLTMLSVVRLPVELVLFWLCAYKVVSPQMTFEGSNPDILSGITAPVVLWLTRKNQNRRLLMGWHIACLLLLLNIVTIAILSAPTPFQQLSFDQPNIAVLYFPFTWLPSVIVPLVLYSHVISIRSLLLRGKLVAQAAA